MRYFIPDSVADEVHERKIPDGVIYNLPLAQAVVVIDAYDGYQLMGKECFEYVPSSRHYRENDGVGILEVNIDRSHYYGIVFSFTDHMKALRVAETLLDNWRDD